MNPKSHSYSQLDSLRGVASLQVMNQHLLFMSPLVLMDAIRLKGSTDHLEQFVYFMQFSPLHLIFMAYEAVLFFFVLSGFVLYTSLRKKVDFRIYGQYIIKRFFRLYLPVVAAILLSVICRAIFYNQKNMSELSWWFAAMWNHPVGLIEFFELIIFKQRDFHNTVTSLWSIDVELKISILIPAIVFCIDRFRRFVLIDALMNLIILVVAFFTFHYAIYIFSNDRDVAYNLFIMRFGFAFIAGIMLGKYIHYFLDFARDLSLPLVLVITIIAFLFYGFNWYAGMLPPFLHQLFVDGYSNEFIILASCMFIVISFNKHISKVLNNKRLLHLGAISFSLYLLHPIVLLSTTYLLFGLVPLPFIWAIVIVVSLVAAHFFYTWFEMPVNNFGRKLAGKLGGNR